jgi:hypothetical protein
MRGRDHRSDVRTPPRRSGVAQRWAAVSDVCSMGRPRRSGKSSHRRAGDAADQSAGSTIRLVAAGLIVEEDGARYRHRFRDTAPSLTPWSTPALESHDDLEDLLLSILYTKSRRLAPTPRHQSMTGTNTELGSASRVGATAVANRF